MTNQSQQDPLTDRQREVAALIADDLTNGEIADQLEISLATTKHHVSEILARLQLRRREAVGDWYQARYRPGTMRRLRGASTTPIAIAAGSGVVTVAVIAVVLALALLATDDEVTPLLVVDAVPPPSQIVAYSQQPGPNASELWLRDLDTAADTLLLAVEDGFEDIRDLHWDVHQETFVFSATSAGDRGIYRIDLDGNVSTLEVPGRQPLLFARWTADGQRLALVTTQNQGGTSVTIVEADASVEQLAGESVLHAWAPDGDALYYQRLRAVEGQGVSETWRHGLGGDIEIMLATEALGEHELRGVTSETGRLLFDVEETTSSCPHVIATDRAGEPVWVAPGQFSSAAPRGDLVAIGVWNPLLEPCSSDPLLAAGGRVVANEDWPPNAVVVLDASGEIVMRLPYPDGGFLSGLAGRTGGDGAPSWDGSATQLLIQARDADGIELVWLADIATGELTLLNRAATGGATFGDAWIAVAFGP